MKTYYSDELELKNLIYCLEFLSQQAVNNRMLKESSVLQNAITEISNGNSFSNSDKSNIEYYDIINAFKVFARFCLIEDRNIKKQILNLIENLDMDDVFNQAVI